MSSLTRRSLPTQYVRSNTMYRAEHRTHFCTTRGWFAYRNLTRTMRQAVLSADGGVGPVAGWVTTQTANRLERMGLVEWRGLSVHLTHHGGLLWCELDDI